MKTILILLLLTFGFSNAQNKSISLVKKSVAPILIASDTLRIGDFIEFRKPSNAGHFFLFVKDLNGFNEPMQFSSVDALGKKQSIKFFKEQDGIVYAFTKHYSVNISEAVKSEEITLHPKK